MTAIELRNLSKADLKGGRPLLDSVNLTVPEGTSMSIVGTRNAGKSLLLKMIVGLDYPSEGEVLMDEALVNLVDPRDRDVAMVFQDFEIYPHLDVFDNIAFSSTLRKGFDKTALADRVQDVAEFLGLGDRLDVKPKDLTESERQRVALGRVLVRDASLYLFDDALSTLDDRLRGQIRSLVAQWQREQARTSVFVTNDVAEALSLGDRVAVMHQGFIHQIDTPRNLYEQPNDLFVAGFVGSPAMNLIPATLTGNSLHLPFITLPLGEVMQKRTEGRDLLIVGIRPEDCEDATGMTPEQLRGKVVFSTKVDDVEWRGSSQYAYLGFEMDEETEARLEEIEHHLDFDLFQAFMLAEIGPTNQLKADMFVKLAVDSAKIHVFDPTTGENLTVSR